MRIARNPAAPRCIASGLLLLALAGCGGGGAGGVRYYLVDPVETGAVSSAGAGQPAVEIMDVHIPQYLERFHIASRSASGVITYSELNQWSESLRKNLLRTLALNLSAILGTTDVSTPLNRSLSRPDYRIQVHIDRFEQDVDGRVRLSARWQVIETGADSPPASYVADMESGERVDRGDYAGMVAAMRDLYGRLGHRIADSLDGGAAR